MQSPAATTELPGRSVPAAAAAAHLVVAIALLGIAVAQASVLVPVTLSIPGAGTTVLGRVDFAAAAAVVLLVSTVGRAAVAAGARGAMRLSRARSIRFLELSQVSGITLFLIALLNGVTEAGTLILTYAIGAGTVVILWLQSRDNPQRMRSPWPFSIGAALAAVPWGIVALHQIAAIVVAVSPPPLVRVLTVVVLLISAAAWWVERLRQLGTLTSDRSDLLHSAVSLANGVLLLVLAAGLARPSVLL